MMCLTHFMTIGVKAIGGQLKREEGFCVFGIGQITEVFQTLGTLFSLTDNLNSLLYTTESLEEHDFKSLPLMLSGPTAFLVFSL